MHQALERAAHGFGAAEAAFFGDEFDRLGRLFEPAPRGFDADLRHETRGRHADLLGEDPREIARTHPGLRGHSLDGQPIELWAQGRGVSRATAYRLLARIKSLCKVEFDERSNRTRLEVLDALRLQL